MSRRPQLTLAEAVEMIVDNDDVSIPEHVTGGPVGFLSGLISVAVAAAIYGVSQRTVARKVYQLAKMEGRYEV